MRQDLSRTNTSLGGLNDDEHLPKRGTNQKLDVVADRLTGLGADELPP